jgi:hypothetical protein
MIADDAYSDCRLRASNRILRPEKSRCSIDAAETLAASARSCGDCGDIRL